MAGVLRQRLVQLAQPDDGRAEPGPALRGQVIVATTQREKAKQRLPVAVGIDRGYTGGVARRLSFVGMGEDYHSRNTSNWPQPGSLCKRPGGGDYLTTPPPPAAHQ